MANPYGGGYPGQQPYGAPGGYGAPPGYGAPQGYGPPGSQPGYGAAPAVDPQVYQWFRAIDRDNSGQLNAIELQQALTNGNWSHFNAETCRLMISMFDRNQSGKIDLNEFVSLWTYINQWKQTFDRYDRDRSGYIEINELQQALTEMGYRLSPDFVALMMRRFDTENVRRLKFDNFIQASVMLKTLTDGFRQRDHAQQGVITINYEDFMSMVLLHMPLNG